MPAESLELKGALLGAKPCAGQPPGAVCSAGQLMSNCCGLMISQCNTCHSHLRRETPSSSASALI